MNVTVVGAGYVGLTTATALAWVGHDVRVVEVDEAKLACLRAGSSPFFESHLDDVLQACRERLRFTSDHEEAVRGSEVVFIAVGTPTNPDGMPDLTHLHAAFGQVLDAVRGSAQSLVVVTKSTVPVGTGDRLAALVRSRALTPRVHLASNPEFLRQGRALADSLYPDRIVVGGSGPAVSALRRLYRPIVERHFEPPAGLERPAFQGPVPFQEVDLRSAELAKYAANAFLAMRISFINEVANVADLVGADVDEVASAIGADPRIGLSYLQAGLGYGGSCLPKDARALHQLAAANGYEFELLAAAMRVNDSQRARVVGHLEFSLGGLTGKRVALLGLAFKPGTDDMREAPSVQLAADLLARGAQVTGHDPRALANAERVMPAGVRLVPSVSDALQGADAAVLVTEWPEYAALKPEAFLSRMRRPLVVDGRNALSADVRRALEYRGIGLAGRARAASEPDALAAD